MISEYIHYYLQQPPQLSLKPSNLMNQCS